jgi:large subunit ribosomal protein L16
MLQPKRTKFNKSHKAPKRLSMAHCGNKVSFGEYGLKSLSTARISSRQIEAGRRAISNSIKRGGKVWIRMFPDRPVTKKPMEVRMGKGKGNVEFWVAYVRPGHVLYEIEGVSKPVAYEALRLASAKLSLITTIIKRRKVW